MNNKYCVFYIILSMGVPLVGQDEYTAKLPEVVVALNVIDEDSGPVEGCSVHVSDYIMNEKTIGRFSEGATDANGHVDLVLRALSGVGVYAEKNGYYDSMVYPGCGTPVDKLLRFDPFIDDGIDRTGTYESPPMKKRVELKASIVMREKKNPTPLYARRVDLDIPARDVWLGYDLVIGDWLPPYGRGESKDLQFRSSPMEWDPAGPKTGDSGVLEVNFGVGAGFLRVDEKNGWLAVSKLKMPHEAPMEGYLQEPLKIEASSNVSNSEVKNAKGYFFRCRAQFDGDKVINAQYGKVLGQFDFWPYISERHREEPPKAFGNVKFLYYLNPKPDERNLEFDLEKNLFDNGDFSGWIEDP